MQNAFCGVGFQSGGMFEALFWPSFQAMLLCEYCLAIPMLQNTMPRPIHAIWWPNYYTKHLAKKKPSKNQKTKLNNIQGPVCKGRSSGFFDGQKKKKEATGVMTLSKRRSRTARRTFLSQGISLWAKNAESGLYIYVQNAFWLWHEIFRRRCFSHFVVLFGASFVPHVGFQNINLHALQNEIICLFCPKGGGLSRSSNCRGFHNSPPATSTCMQKNCLRKKVRRKKKNRDKYFVALHEIRYWGIFSLLYVL